MLKIYIISSIIAMVLSILFDLRCRTKNIKEYRKLHFKNRPSGEKLISKIKDMICAWIPVLNILVSLVAIYFLLASDLTVIKFISKVNKEKKTEEEQIKRLIERG